MARYALEARLTPGEGSVGFLTGGVTFCAMLPMRSIPFKVIALVGMGSRAFPRTQRPAGFDLIASHPRAGDRSAREEDRYLFLEALLSAREKLTISYVGQSIKDNSEIPPSVVVSELIEAVEQGFTLGAAWWEYSRSHLHPPQASGVQPFLFRGLGQDSSATPRRT